MLISKIDIGSAIFGGETWVDGLMALWRQQQSI